MANYRNTIRRILINILSLNSKPNPGIHILNGHFLSRDENADGQIFRELLNKLIKYGIKLIDFELAVNLITENKIPESECLIAFTFDDGFKECFSKIRPVLNEFGLKAAFFVNPGFIDGNEKYRDNFKKNIVETDKEPMSWDELKILSDERHVIGAHTIDHINLNIDIMDELEYQIGQCKSIIENKLGKQCNYFAYPFGKLENLSNTALTVSKNHFKHIFSQSNYRNYYSFNQEVINRRHFECEWPYRHVLYFLKSKN